jgi:hypothetical protein
MELLMEDAGGVVIPTTLHNLRKSPDGGHTLQSLTESDLAEFRAGNLFESVTDPKGHETLVPRTNTFLHESRGSDGFLYVVGPMARCDAKNGNGRVYERGIWESVKGNKNIVERFNRGGSKGHLEHPKDGKTDLNLVSHVMVPYGNKDIMHIDEDGIVHGKARILNTTSGKQLQELYRGGVCVGFSSRGKGSTFRRGNVDYVAKDYIYDTHDAVASPSVIEATPGLAENYSSKPDYTLASTQYESIQSLTEASSMSSSKDLLRKLEDNLRSLAESLDDSNDAISLASLRESLLDQQMGIRAVIESDPTSRDVAEELAEAAKALRAEVTNRMEALKDAKIQESVSGALNESLGGDEVSQLREALRDTKDRLDYYQAACEELAESDELVTRREYEAALALSEGLLKKCKEFQAENEALAEALEESGAAELAESVSEHPEYQHLAQRYEKSLLIIEELTERIRGAQVADRVEEVIKIEPRFARIRDDLLECQTVDEVNSRVARLGRLFVAESEDGSLSEQDVLAILSEGFNGRTPVSHRDDDGDYLAEGFEAPQPRRVPLSNGQAHRMSLIQSLCGTTTFRK